MFQPSQPKKKSNNSFVEVMKVCALKIEMSVGTKFHMLALSVLRSHEKRVPANHF